MFYDFGVESRGELMQKKSLAYENGQFKILNGNKYRFHGSGCNFSNANFEIDWDFGGFKDQWCGINPGLFCYYLKTEYNQEQNLKLYNRVKEELDSLVDKKVMVQYKDLYYFVVDLTEDDIKYLKVRKRSSKHKTSSIGGR